MHATDANKDEEAPLIPKDGADLKAPQSSEFLVIALYSVLTVTNFTVAIPTSARYTASLGASVTLAGLLVGLVPLFSGLVQPIVYKVLPQIPLRDILLVGCAVNIAANVLYSLAPLTKSFYSVLIARCVMGCVGGPAYVSTFIARTTCKTNRLKYMLKMSGMIGLGYALGPLLGLACEGLAHAFDWTGSLLDANTVPGWLMVVLFIFEGLALLVYAQRTQPPKKSPPSSEAVPTSPLPWTSIFVFYFAIFMVSVNVAAFEIMSIFRSTQEWGWRIEIAALTLGCANLVCVALAAAHLNLNRRFKDDRVGALASFLLTLGASILFFVYGSNKVLQVITFIFGGIILLYSMQNAKGFIFSINSKWSGVPKERSRVMMFNNMLYMAGRGIGAIVAPYSQPHQWFGVFIVCVNVAALAAVGIGFKLVRGAANRAAPSHGVKKV